MKHLVIVLVLFAVNALAYTQDEALGDFITFQKTYKKSYSDEEYVKRFLIFKNNMENAAERQKREKGTARFGMTKFSDLSKEEFAELYLMPKHLHSNLKELYAKGKVANTSGLSLPSQSSFDWRSKGAITPVYNQEQCGSCWAFSATETMESYWFLAGHTLQSLSMQQVVDCDSTCYGCGGGWTYLAFEYVIGAGGIEPYSDYPYVAHNENCNFNGADIAAKITAWQYVTQTEDENAMLAWTGSKGPISVCVDASEWSSYQGGVLSTCGDSIDHCVMITGYDTMSGKPIWNVRNSWGTDWGVNGYIFIERGSDVCGIAEVATAVSC